ncbi:hypothetical protein RSOL_310540, partial [Rhizoctonia solani AG-3 Rhs1AP]
MHTPDLLHQCHKGVFKDHLAKWIPKILGKKEVDLRYKLMPRHHGIRHFKRGVSKMLPRSTGREAKEMMKVFLPVAADAGPKVVEATRALLKFMYLAHAATLTETELEEMDRQLRLFHDNKDIFDHLLKTDRRFHNIPKFHQLQHYTHSIRMLGTPDGYNTEGPERLHIDLTKAGFKASNKIDDTELEQMKEYVMRMDALAMHRAYLTHRDRFEVGDDSDKEEDAYDGRERWWKNGEMGEDDKWMESDDEGMEHEEISGSNSDDDEDEEEEGWDEGCEVERLIQGQPQRGPGQENVHGRDDSAAANEPKIFYPDPEIVTAKGRRKKPSTVEYLIQSHSATNLVRDLSTFLKTLDPSRLAITLPLDATLHIWTIIRLFHPPLPFKPFETPQIDHVRARPQTSDLIGRTKWEFIDIVPLGSD